MFHDLVSTTQTIFSTKALFVLGLTSVVLFVVSIVAIPVILVRLRSDYFDVRIPRPWMRDHHPALRVIGHVVKNIMGAVFLLAGIAMLVLPGQGILTILIGISLLEFPGKRRLEAKLVGQPKVFNAINAMRKRFGRPPLTLAPADDQQAQSNVSGQRSASTD